MYGKLSNHCLVDGILGWHDSRGRVIVLDAEGVGPTQTPDTISKCLWTIVLLMMCHGGKAGDKQKLIFRVFIMEYCTFSLVPLGKVRWDFSLDHPCSPWRRCTARGIQQSKHQTSISVLSTWRLSKYSTSSPNSSTYRVYGGSTGSPFSFTTTSRSGNVVEIPSSAHTTGGWSRSSPLRARHWWTALLRRATKSEKVCQFSYPYTPVFTLNSCYESKLSR